MKRLTHFFNSYWVTVFSIHRTEEFLEDCKAVEHVSLESFREITLSSLPIIRGKSKKLDCLYLMRQIHEGRYMNPSLLELLIKPSWQPSFMAFHDVLVEKLVYHEGMESSFASNAVKNAYWIYFSRGVKKTSPQELTLKIKFLQFRSQMGRRWPIIKAIYRQCQIKLPRFHEQMSLPVCLESSFPYHEEFMAVFDFFNPPPPSN